MPLPARRLFPITLVSLVLLTALPWSAPAQAPYLADEVSRALDVRDDYIRNMALPAASVDARAGARDLQALDAALAKYPDPNHPWYCFYKGIAISASSPTPAREYLGRALALAQTDPGTTWLITSEFLRRGWGAWADTSLNELEKQLLARGAGTTRVVAEQVMYESLQLRGSGRTEEALRLATAALGFDPDATWPSLWQARAAWPAQFAALTDGLVRLRQTIMSSWQVQLAAAHYLLKWLWYSAILLIVGVFFAMFIKYFTRSIHPYVELFPQAVPAAVRTVLVASVVFSILAFGPLLLFWVLAFLLWSCMWQRERFVMTLCLIAITLSPVASRLDTALRACRSPESTPSLYTRALTEGFSPALHQRLATNLQKNAGDVLAHLACALSALKADSTAVAAQHVQNAERINPNDPMVLMVAGVVDHELGKSELGRKEFERCMQLQPEFAAPYFNLGKSYLEAMETLKGQELITRSTKLRLVDVNGFIQKNDHYFGRDWPRLRHFLLADYPPRYFWETIFPRYMGTWDEAGALWGVTFLGISPLHSLVIFIALLLVLLVRESVVSASRHTRVRKVLSCDLCHAPMCKRCSTGPYCRTCYESLRAIHVEQKRQAAKVHLHLRARRRERWIASLLDVVFPGSGMLFETTIHRQVSLLFVSATALLYGLYWSLSGYTFAYPQWVTDGLYTPVFVLGSLYTLMFIIRGALVMGRKTSSQEN